MPAINTARRLFVALTLGLLTLPLSACGGEDPEKLVSQTFGAKHQKLRSGRITLAFNLAAQGSPQLSKPVGLRVSGPFQSQGPGKVPQFDVVASISASGQSFSAGAVSTGQAGFLKVQGSAYQLPGSVFSSLQQVYRQAQSQAQAERSSQGRQSRASLHLDPRSWLTDAETKGDEDVAGASTTHVSARVDVPKLVTDVNRALRTVRSQGGARAGQLPPAITPQQQKQVTDAIRAVTFDFWTGKDDKILRRLVLGITFQVPAAERTQARGVTGGKVRFNYEVAEVNKPQQIAAPPNPRPFSQLRSALGSSFLGGFLSGSGATSPGGTPSGSTTSPSSAATQAYVRCLQEAAGDITKQQQCASLIGR